MKIRMRKGALRTGTALALTTVLALTATACGDDGSGAGGDKGDEGSGKGEITFWDNNTAVRRDVWKEIIKDFEKANPDIEVKYVGIPAENVQSKYDTAIQGGGLPDVGGVGTAMLAGIAAQNALEPLDDRLATSSLNGKLNDAFTESVKAAGGSGSKLFAVPTSANNGVLYYRTDMFKKAGLAAPTTWTAFFDAATKLTDSGDNQFGYTIRGGEGSIAQALDVMYGQSGITSFWNADNTRTTVNDPKNVKALEKYVGLYKKATPSADVNNDFTKMVAQFDSGRIGMLSHNLGSYGDHVKAFKTAFRGLPNPTGDDGTRVQVSNPVDGLGLFRSSKNKTAAWKFIEFAASHAENSKWNESAKQIPANTEAAKDAWVQDSEPTRLAADALSSGSTKIVDLPYYLPDWNTISKSDNEKNLQKVLLGKETSQEFLDTLAEQLNKAQDEWQAQAK
ncbi:sugar ABC transporter substrate-binding protein [Streptomyces sp. SID14478]|uniref:ABC transporter substrate-binding protein n=1 Tax=Streptomyces sp. SID14478 TaxID=2706073 RepID=UPI0013D907FC|nr:sugar ABC transporter substrate-binding protein [Streptomyces sp. SID14478]NEB75713.1 sugar ABC transporter substrate-binding protein [Streptomyces sp. SID14478]